MNATETRSQSKADAISEAARAENSWEVLSIHGEGADGIVLFHNPRDSAVMGGKCHGTARFAYVRGEQAQFYWGHYGLSCREAREDFASRVAKGY